MKPVDDANNGKITEKIAYKSLALKNSKYFQFLHHETKWSSDIVVDRTR